MYVMGKRQKERKKGKETILLDKKILMISSSVARFHRFFAKFSYFLISFCHVRSIVQTKLTCHHIRDISLLILQSPFFSRSVVKRLTYLQYLARNRKNIQESYARLDIGIAFDVKFLTDRAIENCLFLTYTTTFEESNFCCFNIGCYESNLGLLFQ